MCKFKNLYIHITTYTLLLLFAILIISTLAVENALGATLYVPADYNTIQAAIDDANNNDTIVVSPGRYYENIQIRNKGVVIISSNPNDPNIVANTIIDGNDKRIVALAANEEHCVISGFTITNGAATNGAGIYGFDIIKKCIITDNHCTTQYGVGGGVAFCTELIEDCIISGNSAYRGGGLAYCNSIIRKCTIVNNQAEYQGGGIHGGNGSIITHCIIEENTAGSKGGGISYSSHDIFNCIVRNNMAEDYYGGGFYDCDGNIQNCTVVANSTTNNYYGAMYGCNGNISNSIFYNNGINQFSSSTEPTYSCIHGSSSTDPTNINTDPLLEPDGIHLSVNSPCIDAGDPNYIFGANETDIDDTIRVFNILDMGADEVYCDTSPLIVTMPDSIDFQVETITSAPQNGNLPIKNYGIDVLNWNIEIPNDCNWLSISKSSGQLNTGQIDDVQITVYPGQANYGINQCLLTILDPNAENHPLPVTVNLVVIGPLINIDKTNIYFTAYGKSDDEVAGQQLMITNTGYDTLNWRIEMPNDCNWLSVSPLKGQVTDGNSIVTLSVDPNKAPQYGNSCTLQIIDPNASNSPQTVEVRLTIRGPRMEVYPRREIEIFAGKNKISTGTFSITNTGYDTLDWNIEVSDDCNCITAITPPSGSCGHNETIDVTVFVDANSLDLGWHNLYIGVNSPQLYRPQTYHLKPYVYEPNELHVPTDYNTIQEAVYAADIYGDTIVVHPGTYSAHYLGIKSLAIRSTEPDNQDIVASTIIESSIYSYNSPDNHYIDINGLSIIYNPDISTRSQHGLDLKYTDIRISNCVISNWPKGGIYIRDAYGSNLRVLINNSIISKNGYYGIFIRDFEHGDITIQNCTIADNWPLECGIYILDYKSKTPTNISVENCILKNVILQNYYHNYEVRYNSHPKYLPPGTLNNFKISHSCIPAGPNSINTYKPKYTNFVYGPGNIHVDPCFVAPTYLDPNSTPHDPRDDFWVDGDYHLKSQGWRKNPNSQFWTWDNVTSPCIDAGSPGSPLADEPITLIPEDPCNTWGINRRINMGAYGGTAEASIAPHSWSLTCDINNDGRVDLIDFAYMCSIWPDDNDELFADFNRDGIIDMLDVALLTEDWLRTISWH